MVILSNTIKGLQELLNNVNTKEQTFGFYIKVAKTEFMIFSRTTYKHIKLQVNLVHIKKVEILKCLEPL